ncbi:hypothetical protein [Mycoplana ramosa]|uniref:Uncharacterized protein n=1 Tax=Mycoplana ramosa TaxID=40837 RepID=A0ABW3Z260_MYCRA
MQGQGGSYIRQKDGSLKLVSRTDPPKADKPTDGSSAAGAAKKKED